MNSQTSVSTANPFGTNTAAIGPTSLSTLGGTVLGSTNTYSFPPSITSGNYAMQLTTLWNNAGSGANYSLTFTNCVVNKLYGSGSAGLNTPQASATNVTQTSITEFITITAGNASFTITGTGSTTSVEDSDLFVYQIPSPIN